MMINILEKSRKIGCTGSNRKKITGEIVGMVSDDFLSELLLRSSCVSAFSADIGRLHRHSSQE
jgi:hypothetical protein